MRRRLVPLASGFALLAAGLVLLDACSDQPGPASSAAAPAPGAGATTSGVRFTDVTASAGIDFIHDNVGSRHRYLPETMGAGVAFFDYDGDDRPDLYFVNGALLDAPAGSSTPALYRNQGDGRFRDVTEEAGLADAFFGMGVAVGDVDNDGDLDLFVSGLNGDRFYRNRGDGTFADESAAVGLDGRGFGSSAAFLDYDRDGWLDLFVGRYVEWSPEDDVRCSPDGAHRTYCTPEVYTGLPSQLFRNHEGRSFEDVSVAVGIDRLEGKTLGVVPLDHGGDGWPDLAIANDTVRNYLLLNHGDGTFRDAGVELGFAYSLSGATRGAMGIDAGDLDGDGRDDLVVGNFSQEMSAVYRATVHGLYVDDAAQLGVGLPSLMPLAFGTLLVDVDNDSWLDLVLANGHIEPDIALFQRLQSYAQPLQLFRNLGGDGGFELVAAGSDGVLATPWVGRGLAAADLDGDGDLDLVLTQNGRAARLFRNDSAAQAWLRVKLVGRRSHRTGYGARLVAVAGERRIERSLVSGRSYLSASEPIVTFGLGNLRRLDRLEVTWPSGVRQVVEEPELGLLLVVEEPVA